MDHIQMVGTQTFYLGGHIVALGRSFARSSMISLSIPVFWWEMGQKSVYGKTYGRGFNLWLCNFQVFIEFH